MHFSDDVTHKSIFSSSSKQIPLSGSELVGTKVVSCWDQ